MLRGRLFDYFKGGDGHDRCARATTYKEAVFFFSFSAKVNKFDCDVMLHVSSLEKQENNLGTRSQSYNQ